MDESFSIYYNGRSVYIAYRGYAAMKIRLAILIGLIAVMLTACGYWVVEESPVQIGSAVLQENALNE